MTTRKSCLSPLWIYECVFVLLFLGIPALNAAEIPLPADRFVDSIGINTHLDSSQAYDQTAFGALGVRHFREGAMPGTLGFTYLHSLFLTYGIRGNMICDDSNIPPSQYQAAMTNACYESIEGLNEPDQFGPRSYQGLTDSWGDQTYAATIAYQNDLYHAMKYSDLTKTKPVLSPAMGYTGCSSGLRGALFDNTALHWYDGSSATCCHLDSSALPGSMLLQTPGSTVPPFFLTETGWTTPLNAPGTTPISDLAGSKYIPRVLAEAFARSITRSYLFEMIDTPGVYSYGLLQSDSNFTRKPAYTKLQNLIQLLKEGVWNASNQTWTYPTVAQEILDYTLSDPSGNVHHLLLQKSTGEYYLLLWQEVNSFNPITHADVTNQPVTVTLGFNTPIATASLYALTSMAPTATYTGANGGPLVSVSLSIPDEVTVVKLVRGNLPSQPDPVITLYADTATATESDPAHPGKFTVYRSGSTASPLTVNYTLAGTAVNGTDYQLLPGSVVIPTGSAGAAFYVTPKGLTNINGKKSVIATVAPNGLNYSIGYYHVTGLVTLFTGSDLIADFENGIPNWTASPQSILAQDTSHADNSAGDLKWTFNCNGTQWNNEIHLNFATPQDWSRVSKVILRIAEDPSNPAKDMGNTVYFDIVNNGVSASNNASVCSFVLSHEPNYRTIELPLGAFPRNKVNFLRFYVDGGTFLGTINQPRNHIWYIDNIRTSSAVDAPLVDFEDNSLANWTHETYSNLQINTAGADTGVRDLKWTFGNVGAQWTNQINLNFPTPLDLTKKRKLLLRFRADPSNPASDVGQSITMDLLNNGTSASNSTGVAQWTLPSASTPYKTVELDLGSYPREKVNSLYFYVNGTTLAAGTTHAPVNHIWYLDNITFY